MINFNFFQEEGYLLQARMIQYDETQKAYLDPTILKINAMLTEVGYLNEDLHKVLAFLIECDFHE